ncbi:MAG: dihydropteroate synthase [Deltaproteobacteria bacterium]|nr:dihydropteroate synthase [Deltaproteobacteria bacterium]
METLVRAGREMDLIGVDPAGIRIMAPKQLHYNFKVEGLVPAQANVIKQEVLSIGGEAAIARGAASCSIDKSGAVISGTLKQLNILIEKLKAQSFGLCEVAQSLNAALVNMERKEFHIQGRGKSWTAGPRTLIAGILNVTPDSFSDGALFFEKDMAVERALRMTADGADWIDVGGESSRPGASPVSAGEELRRVLPVVEALAGKGIAVSVDTTKAVVAREALKAGAEMINDISALSSDPDMAGVCAEYQCPVILMHMRGTPATMQNDVKYNDIAGEVFDYLSARLDFAASRGIDPEKTIIDPGMGFGKSVQGNIDLIRDLKGFKTLGRPILIGASRKSFINRILDKEGADGKQARLAGSLAVAVAAIRNGAEIVRVHDVKETREAASLADALK